MLNCFWGLKYLKKENGKKQKIMILAGIKTDHHPNIMVEWVALLLCIPEALCSNLDPTTSFPNLGSHDFPQSF
jgi:hypothetical protein